jgi:putative membrane protein
MTTNETVNNEKLIFRWVLGVSIAVFVLVVLLNRKVLPRPDFIPAFVSFLPALNAFINGTCTLLLIASYIQIRKKNIATHKKLNITAFFLSSIFLVSYVLFHFFADETHFPDTNPMRPIYLIILISHIILAALVLPLVLLSFYYGLQMKVDKHRKLVRFTFPIWLYVTITGVVVYLMISPYYTF